MRSELRYFSFVKATKLCISQFTLCHWLVYPVQTNNNKRMKKLHLNNKLKAEHKSDKAVLMETPEVSTIDKDSKKERVKKQFAQDALIHQRVKCPVAAMVCCLMHQVWRI